MLKKSFLVPVLVLSYACIMKRRPLSTRDSKRKVEEPGFSEGMVHLLREVQWETLLAF